MQTYEMKSNNSNTIINNNNTRNKLQNVDTLYSIHSQHTLPKYFEDLPSSKIKKETRFPSKFEQKNSNNGNNTENETCKQKCERQKKNVHGENKKIHIFTTLKNLFSLVMRHVDICTKRTLADFFLAAAAAACFVFRIRCVIVAF